MGNSRNLANLLGTGSTISTAKIADDAITAAKVADNAIGSAAVDLTANYAFTGTVSGTNGMTLLTSLNETSDTDYDSDVTIFNFDSHTSTYGVFFFQFSVYLTGNGNCHCYLATGDASTTKLNMRTVGRGFADNGGAATPQTGSGSYHRFAFNAAGPNIAHLCQGYIYNGQRSDDSYDAGMSFLSNWHYSGIGQVAAKHATMVTTSGDQISRIMLNLDGGTSSAATNFNARVKGSLWGIV